MRVDHIFIIIILYCNNYEFPTSVDFHLRAYALVVEASPIRSLPADYLISIIFKHSHLGLFHPYAVVY